MKFTAPSPTPLVGDVIFSQVACDDTETVQAQPLEVKLKLPEPPLNGMFALDGVKTKVQLAPPWVTV